MQPRVKIWISIALLGTVACGDDGSPPADDAASSSTTDPGTTTMIADVPGECDHVPLSDDPVVDMYAEHLMAVVSVHEAAQARIDGARAMLAEAFALPADATIDEVMAAFSASVDEMTGDARLAWSDALMCADTLEAARAAARDCDAATSGDSPVVCRGVCIQPDVGPNVCDGATLGCGNADFEGACAGSCDGTCTVEAAGCTGVCRGECSQPCSVTEGGACAGWCMGDCTGTCESATTGCYGTCSGACFLQPGDPQCEAEGFATYCESHQACVGQCLGASRVSGTNNYCSVLSEAASVAAVACPPARVVMRWTWVTDPAEMPPEDLEAFTARATAVEIAFGEMVGAYVELQTMLAYIQALETERNLDNPLLDYFEGPCALPPLTAARESLLASATSIEDALGVVQTIVDGLPQ
jgi:hypothetical protein